MSEEIPELKNAAECAIQWNNVRILLNGLIKHMEIYVELFDPDEPFESFIIGRTQTWIEVFKAYQKEIAEGPD